MRRHAHQALTVLAATGALVLAGCGTSSRQAAAPTACPTVAVVGDTSEVTKFASATGRDPTDVALIARIADFDGGCTTDVKRGRVAVDLKLTIEGTRGPANRDGKGAYDYFVAIADAGDNIVAKRVFPGEVAFNAATSRTAVVDELTQSIPLKTGETGAAYRIYLGFQLTDAELAYNRDRRLR